ncbi:MAG: four helix bundle protein [Bacteroidia bacterium]|nr:four helix bundle protein [Bacteroidia bacterium]MBP7261246.1 four helix bundle protein [Bacteroidia bacterium]MBP9180198.1 four helix bundle protein [Bacteroidia bacterium]MBP9725172.1 four helix bundle protein [Bacteroidia bacterium]
MSEGKIYDLEERTFIFAKRVRDFVRLLPLTISNKEDIRQLIRSSGSIGANYIEANENLGEKDKKMRIRISRKEAKETRYWLNLIETKDVKELEEERRRLATEAEELMLIFGTIIKRLN